MGCFELNVDIPPCFKTEAFNEKCFSVSTEVVSWATKCVDVASGIDNRTITLCFIKGNREGEPEIYNEETIQVNPFLDATCGEELVRDTSIFRKIYICKIKYLDKIYEFIECEKNTLADGYSLSCEKRLPNRKHFSIGALNDAEVYEFLNRNSDDVTLYYNEVYAHGADPCNDPLFCDKVRYLVNNYRDWFACRKITIDYERNIVTSVE